MVTNRVLDGPHYCTYQQLPVTITLDTSDTLDKAYM